MIYIYTVIYNTPEFIEYQYNLFKKFTTNDFEYIIFNNTNTNSRITDTNSFNYLQLVKICNKNSIKYIDVPRELYINVNDNNASLRAGISIDFATKYMINNYNKKNDILMLIDADAFLIDFFDINKFMNNCNLSGRYQYRKNNKGYINKYITNQIVLYKHSNFSLNDIKYLSFRPGIFNGVNCDCGGSINYIFENVKDINFKNWTNYLFSGIGNTIQMAGEDVSIIEHYNLNYNNTLSPPITKFIDMDTKKLNKKFPFCEIFTHKEHFKFLHLRSGTNWINYDINERKKLLYNTLNDILK